MSGLTEQCREAVDSFLFNHGVAELIEEHLEDEDVLLDVLFINLCNIEVLHQALLHVGTRQLLA